MTFLAFFLQGSKQSERKALVASMVVEAAQKEEKRDVDNFLTLVLLK